jgi:hypothetical protein
MGYSSIALGSSGFAEATSPPLKTGSIEKQADFPICLYLREPSSVSARGDECIEENEDSEDSREEKHSEND